MQSAASQPQTLVLTAADGQSEPDRSTKKLKHMKRSFAEATVPPFTGTGFEGGASEDWYMEDPVVEPDIEIPEGETRDGVPIVVIPKDLRVELCKSWKKALIIKFLGKPVSFGIFQQRLLRLWDLKGKYELIDIGEGFYVVRLELKEDYLHVLTGGALEDLRSLCSGTEMETRV